MKATVRCGLPYTMVPFAMVLLFFGAAGSHFWIAMYGLATAVFVGVSVPVSMSISSEVLSVRFMFRKRGYLLNEVSWLRLERLAGC